MSPRTIEQNEIIRKQRREQIMAAGSELYAERGIQGMELGTVAKKIGIVKGTIYHYFNNKYELIREILEKEFEIVGKASMEIAGRGGNPVDRMSDLFRYHITYAGKTPPLFRFYKNLYEDGSLIFGETDDDNYFGIVSVRDPYLKLVEEAIAQDLIIPFNGPRQWAYLWGILIGCITMYSLHPDSQNEPEFIDDILHIIHHGVLKHKT